MVELPNDWCEKCLGEGLAWSRVYIPLKSASENRTEEYFHVTSPCPGCNGSGRTATPQAAARR